MDRSKADLYTMSSVIAKSNPNRVQLLISWICTNVQRHVPQKQIMWNIPYSNLMDIQLSYFPTYPFCSCVPHGITCAVLSRELW